MSEPIVQSLEEEYAWQQIEAHLAAGTLIPVIGRGAITFGPDDQPFYEWLLQQLSTDLGITPVPKSLHDLVCLAKGTEKLPLLRHRVDKLVQRADLVPGPLMTMLASISQCRTYFTLGFDLLLERALKSQHGKEPLIWNSHSTSRTIEIPDFPQGTLNTPALGYLFGRTSTSPDSFNLWDADAIEFVIKLQSAVRDRPMLKATLQDNHLLFIGAEMSDWALRFLLRALHDDNFSKGQSFRVLAEGAHSGEAMVFFRNVNDNITFLHTEPITFARRFCDLALRMSPSEAKVSALEVGPIADEAPQDCIFISYRAEDRDAAVRIARKLQSKGAKVWLDVERLRGGNNFEDKLQRAVATSRVFISLISRNSEAVYAGYFIKERGWARERFKYISDSREYYFPIVIDDQPFGEVKNEPKALVEQRHFERIIDGEMSDERAEEIAKIQLSPLAHS